MGNYNLRRDQKISLYTALVSFFFSFLIGVIAGNPIGIILMRAILASILFGALIYGGIYILKRYIPELGIISEESEGRTDQVGKKVDYSISDSKSKGKMPLRSVPEAMESAFESDMVHGPVGEPGEEALAEGVTAEADISTAPGAAAREAQPEAQPSGVSAPGSEERESDLEEGLPSLDRLFEERTGESIPDSIPKEKPSEGTIERAGRYIEVGDARFPNEPETLAKAVKKVMKQDE